VSVSIDRQLSGALAAVLFILLIAATSLAGAGLLAEPEQFREDVVSWGAAGIGVACGLAVIHAVVPYPAELLSLGTGYAYGFLPALTLMLVLWTVSCLVAFWLGRKYGRPLVGRLVKQRALERAESAVADASTGTLLALRIIPIVPYNLVSYPSGMFGVPLGRFTWTTALGLAPQVAVVTYAGSEAVELSPTDLRIWAVGLGWLALILVGRWLARRIGTARPDVR
jgi:uncharacterized membrane protein YdjX (TVP38/TMEM64 family)